MHELGIALKIVEIAAERAAGRPVRRVVIEVGVLTAVLPEALEFSFAVATQETPLEGARLQIDRPLARARCQACGRQLAPASPLELCVCGSPALEWLSGDELRIRELEVA